MAIAAVQFKAANPEASANDRIVTLAADIKMYNGLKASAQLFRANYLDKIVLSAMTYLTEEPPQTVGGHPDPYWAGLAVVVQEALTDAKTLERKLLSGPRNANAWRHAGPWLERVSQDHLRSHDISSHFTDWLAAQGGGTSFWAYLGTLNHGAEQVKYRKSDRARWQIYVDQGVWKRKKNNQLADTTYANNNQWRMWGNTGAGPTDHERNLGTFVADFNDGVYIRHDGASWHHSSFMSGEPVLAAGLIAIRQGRVRLITAESGHYKPTEANMKRFLQKYRSYLADAIVSVEPFPATNFYTVADYLDNPHKVPVSTAVIAAKKNNA